MDIHIHIIAYHCALDKHAQRDNSPPGARPQKLAPFEAIFISILERFYTFARTYFSAGEPSQPARWKPEDNLIQATRRKR